MTWINILSQRLITVGKAFKMNLKINFHQRLFVFLTKFYSSGTFGGSFSNYNEIYKEYLSNNICDKLVNTNEDVYLPGKIKSI